MKVTLISGVRASSRSGMKYGTSNAYSGITHDLLESGDSGLFLCLGMLITAYSYSASFLFFPYLVYLSRMSHLWLVILEKGENSRYIFIMSFFIGYKLLFIDYLSKSR